jgi:hypothetical protein
MQPLSDIERLVIAQALLKTVTKYTSTKDHDSLRARADADMLENYERMGMKSIDLRINGEKVGTYSVKVSKPTSAAKSSRVVVDDSDAAYKWAMTAAKDEYNDWCIANIDRFCEYALSEFGEVADGAHVVTDETAAQPERATGTVLKVDPPKVAHALGTQLPQAVAGLLTGGES